MEILDCSELVDCIFDAVVGSIKSVLQNRRWMNTRSLYTENKNMCTISASTKVPNVVTKALFGFDQSSTL